MKLIYDIPMTNYETLEKKIEKLNRRAVKLGYAPIGFRLLSTSVQKDADTGDLYEFGQVEIAGEPPTIDGYVFAGDLYHEHGVTTVHSIADEEIPHVIQDRDLPACEHCNTRRKRKHTFVLREVESGKYVQVGTSCLRDFMGDANDPHSAAAMATMLVGLDELAEESKKPGWGAPITDGLRYDLRQTLRIADGYIREKKLRPDAYRVHDSVRNIIDGRNLTARTEMTDEDFVDAAIDWAKGLEPSEHADDDHLRNVKAVADNGYIGYKNLRLAVGILNDYDQATGGNGYPRGDGYVGYVGQELTLELTVKRTHDFTGHYGASRVISCEDAAGNVVMWFANGEARFGWTQGVTYRVRCQVQQLSTYKRQPQTQLVRVQRLESLAVGFNPEPAPKRNPKPAPKPKKTERDADQERAEREARILRRQLYQASLF